MSAETDGGIITVVGIRGSGKTTKVRELVRASRRLLVADPEKKYELTENEILVTSGRELREVVHSYGLLDRRAAFRIVYRDAKPVIRITAPGVALALGDCTCVLDELACFCSPNELPEPLDNIIIDGRQKRVNLIGTTREPQEIHDRCFSQADLLYFFHVEPGNGLDRIRRRYKEDFSEKLPQLARFQYETRLQAMGLSEQSVTCKLSGEGLQKLDKPLRADHRAGVAP